MRGLLPSEAYSGPLNPAGGKGGDAQPAAKIKKAPVPGVKLRGVKKQGVAKQAGDRSAPPAGMRMPMGGASGSPSGRKLGNKGY